MARVIHTTTRFKILQDSRDYIVVRIQNDDHDKHGHFKRKDSAINFIDIIERNEMPYSEYFIEAAKRLLYDIEFKRLKKAKPKGSKGYRNDRGRCGRRAS